MFFRGLRKMKASNFHSIQPDRKSNYCLGSLIVSVSLICGVYFVGSAFWATDYRILPTWRGNRQSVQCTKNRCRPVGSEALPEGIVTKTSSLEMRPLWGPVTENNYSESSVNLLAIAAGIKQKAVVNRIVEKFMANGFAVMLFHYDAAVDEWHDLEWSSRVIHVSAMNQTKWWFAKRFLHPDIVAEYEYIFLWDEDLGVDYFNPERYISIVREEGLEISQPALDLAKSEVHHKITVRRRRGKVHRRVYQLRGNGACDSNSTAPPCVGWVEMMAPVFSRAAWRCTWYMIQNDLIHAWGLDKQLGYCAQGDRTKNVGVVDAEYIVHMGFPTLGGSQGNEDPFGSRKVDKRKVGNRTEVRRQSYNEMRIFKRRWYNAVKEDKCWVDPFNNL